MSSSAKKTDPELWEKVKTEVTEGDKGGKPGQWSARKAQMAVQEYKHEGGGYEGKKSEDNHLVQWQEEDWGTKSGSPSGKTGERYLPKEARAQLTDEEYKRTSDKTRRARTAPPQTTAPRRGRRCDTTRPVPRTARRTSMRAPKRSTFPAVPR